MKKRIICVLLCFAAAAMLTGCNPDSEDDGRESEATTSKVGGFVIEENAPGYDEEWDDLGQKPTLGNE